MTVKELISKLQAMPEEARVAVYCQLSEDSDVAREVQLLTKEDGPYNKGDDVWLIYGLDDSEKIVFVS